MSSMLDSAEESLGLAGSPPLPHPGAVRRCAWSLTASDAEHQEHPEVDQGPGYPQEPIMLANPKWLICFDLWPLGTLKALEGQRPPETRKVTITERAGVRVWGRDLSALLPCLGDTGSARQW